MMDFHQTVIAIVFFAPALKLWVKSIKEAKA